jgi:hypothetical protein
VFTISLTIKKIFQVNYIVCAYITVLVRVAGKIVVTVSVVIQVVVMSLILKPDAQEGCCSWLILESDFVVIRMPLTNQMFLIL